MHDEPREGVGILAAGTKRVPRAIREQQMLDSAIRVFADLGYRSASMDAIARDARISKPMLYLYYGSKEELFGACVARESGRLIEALTSVAAADDGPRQRLEKMVEAFLEFVDVHADSWNVVYRQAFAEPAFRDEVDKTRTALVGLTTELLRHDSPVPPARESLEVVATALVGAGEAVADRVVLKHTPRAEAAATVVALAWRGLSGDRPPPRSRRVPTTGAAQTPPTTPPDPTPR